MKAVRGVADSIHRLIIAYLFQPSLRIEPSQAGDEALIGSGRGGDNSEYAQECHDDFHGGRLLALVARR